MENTTYQVYVGGAAVESSDDEAKAIEIAKGYEARGEQAQVVMLVESGTYKSRTQIYPTMGPTRSL